MRFKFAPKTSEDEFFDVVTTDRRLSEQKRSLLEAVYKRLHQHAIEHEDELARDEKRQQRKAIDALRSRIKRLDPPVELEDTWEQVRTRIEKYEEYAALPTDEDRRAAYDKHISRLQDDADRERARRHERDRTREDRHSTRRERDSRRRSRSAAGRGVDPYEADRRRAIEQRERQYRHTSNGGLSPPPRERRPPRDGGAERYTDPDRVTGRDRQSSMTRYDRERRERDLERERVYNSRADPYGKANELDYGDSSDVATPSRPGSSYGGKRAGSESRGPRAKRARTEKEGKSGRNGVSEDPAEKMEVEAAAKEEIALQSGSEEGEIEEV